MKLKSACLAWFGIFLLMAVLIGALVYRRMGVLQPAVVAGVIGGGLAWVSFGFLAGIRQKLADIRRIRRAVAGQRPVDGERIAAVGRIVPTGSQPLLSPLTRTPAVAYTYRIQTLGRRSRNVQCNGSALIPSAIQSEQGSIRILAHPELLTRENIHSQALVGRNAAEYIQNTKFREAGIGEGVGATIKELVAELNDDDGSIRIDQRSGSIKGSEMGRTLYTEQVISPGDRVCAIGHYSVQRGGLVPDPAGLLHRVTIQKGTPGTIVLDLAMAAIGNLIGALIFLGVVAAGLVMFLAVFRLETMEYRSPSTNPTWTEIRFERLLHRRVRIPLETSGVVDREYIPLSPESGVARGRVRSEGRDVEVRRASAVREGLETTIRIDENLVVLKLDQQKRPVSLQISGQTIDLASSAEDLDWETMSGESDNEFAGRLTYFSDRNPGLASYVSFRASVLRVSEAP